MAIGLFPVSRDTPDWLRARQEAAASRVAQTPLPSTDEEVWRYSLVDQLDLDAYAPVDQPPAGGVPAGARRVLDAVGDRAATVVVRNGFVVHADVTPGYEGRLRVGRLAEAPDGEDAAGVVLDQPDGPGGTGAGYDVFVAMNIAHSTDPVLVEVRPGAAVESPIVVIDWIDADGASVHPHLVVRAGADSESRVLEWHGSDDVAAFAAPVVQLDVAAAARLGTTHVQVRGPRVWQIGTLASQVDRDATLVAAQAGLGGAYARTRADCRLVGRGATGNLLAAYFGERDQTLDFRTFQDHVAPDTTSNLLFKGAVGGSSRSVYTGLIHVGKEARGTNAFQTNRNVKLSEGAWAESVPNLEIENNDVRCSHASTVGPIDEDQRFYLESRGVPPAVADRLVVAGFFEEVLAQLPEPVAAELVREEIDARLDRGDDPRGAEVSA
jgi:Fe-S cluster assembly protein SufD